MPSQKSLSLRFDAGRFESQLLVVILAAQSTILLMVGLGTVGFIYVTIGDLVEPRPLFSLGELVPYLFGGVVAAVGLGRLYE